MGHITISKRVVFPKTKQAAFLETIQGTLQFTNHELAHFLDLHERTIRDWKREKFLMSLTALEKLCAKALIPLPENIKIEEPFWYVTKGTAKSLETARQKYGDYPILLIDPEHRKQKWREWWEQDGKFRKHPIIGARKIVTIPIYSENLAEFVGIVLGDGGIIHRQITISLHHEDDKEYGIYVSNLINQLFKLKPAIYHHQKNSINNCVISRTNLVDFCVQKLGLVVGNKIKQQIDIPGWVKQDQKYKIACLRGLVDTVGSVFTHSYIVGSKRYNYKKLAFTSASPALCNSVYGILQELGIKARIGRNRDIWIDSKKDIEKYFQDINSNNPKHVKRYCTTHNT